MTPKEEEERRRRLRRSSSRPHPPSGTNVLLADRLATLNWQNSGMRSLGGIPTTRNTIFTTLSPSGGDDTSAIQNRPQ